MNFFIFLKQINLMRKQIHYSSYRRSPRMVMRPQVRTRNKFSRNLVIGSSIMLLNVALVFSYFYFGKTENSQAAQANNAVSGMWNAASTWSTGKAPASDDTLTIL